jgi:hypothetical protein
MAKLYNKTEKFVGKYFSERGFKRHIKHLKRTVYWVKKLKPDADEAFLIAALAHDIGHAYRFKELDKDLKKNGFRNKFFLERHQREGAKIIGEFLKKENTDPRIIYRVEMLISKHEEGGTYDQNLLKDADSLSFFENNIRHFLDNVRKFGKGNAIQKIDWMYNRITSKKAKEISNKWYEKAIKKLENL